MANEMPLIQFDIRALLKLADPPLQPVIIPLARRGARTAADDDETPVGPFTVAQLTLLRRRLVAIENVIKVPSVMRRMSVGRGEPAT